MQILMFFFFYLRKVRRQITVTELRRAARKPCRKLNLKIPFYYDNPIVVPPAVTVTTPLPGIAATAPPETLAVIEWIHFWYFCILYLWCITVLSAMLFRKTHQKELKFIEDFVQLRRPVLIIEKLWVFVLSAFKDCLWLSWLFVLPIMKSQVF